VKRVYPKREGFQKLRRSPRRRGDRRLFREYWILADHASKGAEADIIAQPGIPFSSVTEGSLLAQLLTAGEFFLIMTLRDNTD
jgi:hypothetical protein